MSGEPVPVHERDAYHLAEVLEHRRRLHPVTVESHSVLYACCPNKCVSGCVLYACSPKFQISMLNKIDWKGFHKLPRTHMSWKDYYIVL